MKKLVFLAIVDVCRCILPPLFVNNGGYIPTSNLLNNAGYLVQIVPRAPVSYANPFTLYQNPYTPSYVNPQASYAKGLYDDYAKRERLKLLYNSLASKPSNTKLSNIFNNKANNFAVNVPTRRTLNSQSNVSKDSVLENKIESADIKVMEPIAPIADNSKEAVDGVGRKYLKKVTYVIEEAPPTRSAVTYSNSHSHILGKPMVQAVAMTHQNSGHNYISQNALNSGYSTTRLTEPESFGYSWYLPYTAVWNPTTSIRPSSGNALNLGYDYVNVQSDSKEIISYVITLMLSENFISPEIIQALSNAQNINFSKLDEFDEHHLVIMSEKDVKQLKKYLIQTINAYGLTPYTFKLLEYIHLMEGKPKTEVYLISKILADERAIQYYDEEELKQLQRHLSRIYEDYHESPYVLALLKYIEDNQYRPIRNDNLGVLDLDFGIKNNVEREDFRKIYLYLSQSYNDNLNILKILKNINDIYENVGTDIVIPVIELEDLESLTEVSRDDLIILVKYILKAASYSGDNSYFSTLLSYISEIQNSDMDHNISVISDDNAAIKDSKERTDLSLIHNYLLELNRTDANKDVLIILKRLMENQNFDSSVTVSNTTKESLNIYNDLIKIKEFLLRNPRPELNALIQDVIKKINEATKKTEIKVVLQPVILDGGYNVVEISPSDLELIYQYMLKKQTAAPNHYLNEMIQLIKQAQGQIKENDKNGLIRLKYYDLMQIYKYLLQTQEEDINNPVFIKVQQYVDESDSALNIQHDSNNKPTVKTNITSNTHEENEINLEAVYKFILHKTFESQPDPLLLEILEFLNQTLILPNGQLKLKIITSNKQKPIEGISERDISKIMLYLEKLKENSALNNEFSQFLIKGESIVKDDHNHEEKSHPLSVVSNVALNRIKKYLRTLIEEHGENPYIQQIIIEINEILKSQQTEEDHQTINNLDSSINEDDLKTLLQYLTKAINVPDSNNDVAKFLEYIQESQQNIKEQIKNKRKQELLKLYLIQLVNNDDVTPAIKDVLQILAVHKMFENPNSLILELKSSNKLKKLSTDELSQLIEYLQQIKNKVGIESVSQLLANIIKQKEEAEKNKNNISIQTDFYTNENIDENKKDVKISGDDFKILTNENKKDVTISGDDFKILTNENKKDVTISGDDIKILNTYLIDLLNQYGEDDTVLHILYTINHIEDDSEKKSDLTKVLGSSNNNVTVVNIDDLKIISKYLLQLIEHHGMNPQVIKVLRDIENFNKEPEEDFKVSIVDVNSTHIVATIDQTDLNEIQKYLNIMINNYQPSPQILSILHLIEPKTSILDEKQLKNKAEAQNIYTFAKLKSEEISQLTEYLLKLIEKYGMLPEFLNILIFVHKMYHDNYAEIEIPNDINQQKVIVVSEEINDLLQQDVLNTIQSINQDSLLNIYTQLIQNAFVSPNSSKDVNLTNVMKKLLDMYNSELTPVNKYILLKIYDYVTKNKDLNYETLLQPGFVLVLLDLKKDESSKIRPVNVTITEKDRNNIVVEPYDYKKDVESALMKLVENMFKTQEESNDSILRSKNIIANYTTNEVGEDEINKEPQANLEEVSCVDANKKFTVVINILNDLFDLNGQKIDISMQEFLKIYDLLNMFRKRLSLEKGGEVPTSVLIEELERHILHRFKGRCHYQPDVNVEKLMTRLVDALREVIQYLKVNDYDHNTIKATVVSLVERLLPDISAIAVKDCEARTDKELMSMLFSNIYSSQSSEGNKIQFSTGYQMQGNTVEDFLHTSSMQQILEDISKYKNV